MIEGSLVALLTPMFNSGEVNWKALNDLVEWQLEKGTNAIVAMGTTGESATFDFYEHSKVIRQIINWTNGRVPVIAGTGANCTKEAIELTKAAAKDGADACLLVTPYYNRPTQEGLFLHHLAISKACPIPQILYNVPSRTACNMSSETIKRISKFENIIGIKEATGDIEKGKEIIKFCNNNFNLYSGDDQTFLELMKIGAKGNISVTANIAPKQISDICSYALSGNFIQADKLNKSLLDLHDKLFIESNPIPIKWAYHKLKNIENGIRLPLTNLSQKNKKLIFLAMQNANLL